MRTYTIAIWNMPWNPAVWNLVWVWWTPNKNSRNVVRQSMRLLGDESSAGQKYNAKVNIIASQG